MISIGSKGGEVVAWQRFLAEQGYYTYTVDGDFGELTDSATVMFQEREGLQGTGVLDEPTWLRALALGYGSQTDDGELVLPGIVIKARPPKDITRDDVDTERPGVMGDVPGIVYTEARHYTVANRTVVDNVVIHTAETAEVMNAAENLAKWAAGPQAPRASWHYAVDGNSITQSVLERHVAWHAPGANKRGIGVEHAGRASQRAEGWADDYSRAVLRLSAELVAGICKRWGIPIQRVTDVDLRRGVRGICGHVDVTRAFRKSDHVDPGEAFPWDEYLRMVEAFAAE